MDAAARNKIDWRELWASGDLSRFCFVSLGILLHATNETMVATIMPAMVGDLSGVQLVGWSLALYEVGAIVAGAAAARMVSYLALRTTMIGAALIFAVGAAVCGAAPDMPVFLAGRLVQGLGGGALISLAFVSVERLFPRAIWPHLFGIMSAIWGVAAFGGPLIGALISHWLSWRWAFATFVVIGAGMAALSLIALRTSAATRRPISHDPLPPFPVVPLICLALAVLLVALAGVADTVPRSATLLLIGLAGLALFFRLDARRGSARLFPSRLFDLRAPLGRGMVMFGSLAVATCSFTVYGPLILTTLHGISVLTTGYMIAAESIAWSVFAILIANLPQRYERFAIVVGAGMIVSGLVGFAWTVPLGNVPLILACATLQGGGFGVAWPFVTRIIVTSAPAQERTIASGAVPTMQRIGYAVGAATCGLVANLTGFDAGLSPQTAATVAPALFLAFLPLGLLGFTAAILLARSLKATA